MSSPCLSGGGRAYAFDIEIIKSPSSTSSTITTHSSPSSTLSESSNSPLAISTRKPRTPRKRPNQTYNEAAALLSTAYPKIFPAKHLTKNSKFTHNTATLDTNFFSSDLLLLPFREFDNSCFLVHQQQQPIPHEKPSLRIEPGVTNCCGKQCQSPVESGFHADSLELWNDGDFDAESLLDEEIDEGGIDSIMGNLSVDNNCEESNVATSYSSGQINSIPTCYGFPMGLGFGGKLDFRLGMKRRGGGRAALRNVDEEGDWWRFPPVAVDVVDISPKLSKAAAAAAPTEKKKKKIEKPAEVVKEGCLLESPKENSIPKQVKAEENSIPKPNPEKLLLKLNYDQVVKDWSDRGSPFSEEFPGHEEDLHARLAEIDLFSESGGVREASVLRYKEKRRTRLFSKKIRYQVRKVNADRRPRMKGRFVRRPNSPMSEER